MQIDREVVTCDEELYTDWDKPAQEILAEKGQESEEEEEEGGTDEVATTQMCTLTEAQDYIQQIKKLAAHLGDSDLLNSLMSSESILCNIRMKKEIKQTSIKDFFAKCQ